MKTKSYYKRSRKFDGSKGVALITVLLLLLILSAMAVALMYTVNTEQHLQRTDQGNGLAYYSAEAGAEKMTADLADLYNSQAAPTVAQINAIACPGGGGGCGKEPPAGTLNGSTFPEYSIVVPPNPVLPALPACSPGIVANGPEAGLTANICPMTLNVTAVRPGGEEVRMIRDVEVEQVPVFQFGVFSDSDLSFFAGPPFEITGRVHTNGNLFLAAGAGGVTVFHSPIRAVRDVVRDTLGNGENLTASGHSGTVLIPTTTNGCPAGGFVATGTCRALGYNGPDEGSSLNGATQAGIPASGGAVNPNWKPTLSQNTYNFNVRSGTTGATALNLPFVRGNVPVIELIRRPTPSDTALTSSSRLYSKAQVRVLLSDDPLELSPGGAGDPQNVRLGANAGNLSFAVPTAPGAFNPTFVAEEAAAVDPNWTNAGYKGVASGNVLTKNLIDGYLRVEYRDNAGNYIPVTTQWLALGFARQQAFPDSEHGIANTVHPNAILMFQQLADAAAAPYSKNEWYPINMYDTREGNFRDIASGTCTLNGVINLIDIDIRNLRTWLQNTPAAEGVTQNGYILYFSDRRGMIADPNPPLPNPGGVALKTGAYGFEDVINEASSTGTPNGVLDQGEAANRAGGVDARGQNNLGMGFNAAGNPVLPASTAVACTTTARKNWVSGARHGVRLLNGSLGNLPIRPVAIGDPNNTGGFSLVSENPAYVIGNYNADDAGFGDPHASSAVMADTVSLISRNWTDLVSFQQPTNVGAGGRTATSGFFRLAIASGKNRNFSWAATANLPSGARPSTDFGTDGGVHNFLRFLENWGGQVMNYRGSMVNLFFSAYNTGVFKCCATVYSPPNRNLAFDIDFQNIGEVPPGTPMFEDVVNVGVRQDFRNR